jgi:acetyl esterase/lipase
MAARLAAAGVEHELVIMEGAGHGLAGADAAAADSAETRAAAFLRARLG